MRLIDDLRKDGCTSETKIDIDGVVYTGWVDAKPINPREFRTRVKDAWKVFRGKAIATQYYDDLSQDEKREHVKKQFLIT